MASGRGHLLIKKFKESGLTAKEFINKTFGPLDRTHTPYENFCDVINPTKIVLEDIKKNYSFEGYSAHIPRMSGIPLFAWYVKEDKKVVGAKNYLSDLRWLLNKYKREQKKLDKAKHLGFFRRLLRLK